jgi:hypothetical protein
MDDTQAVDRYRYLLRTAPPDQLERAHEGAFSQLTPAQRSAVLRELSRHVDPSEVRGDDPRSLARTATRAELRQPGTMERAFGGSSLPGLGSMFMATLAGAFVGSAIADSMSQDAPVDDTSMGDGDMAATDTGDTGDDFGAGDVDDFGAGDVGDFGAGDVGDFGAGDVGDFGGGDFGG